MYSNDYKIEFRTDCTIECHCLLNVCFNFFKPQIIGCVSIELFRKFFDSQFLFFAGLVDKGNFPIFHSSRCCVIVRAGLIIRGDFLFIILFFSFCLLHTLQVRKGSARRPPAVGLASGSTWRHCLTNSYPLLSHLILDLSLFSCTEKFAPIKCAPLPRQ